MNNYSEVKDTFLVTTLTSEVGAGSFVQLKLRTKNKSKTKLTCGKVDYFIGNEETSPKLNGSVILTKDIHETEVFVERSTYRLDTSLGSDESFVTLKTNPVTGRLNFFGDASSLSRRSAKLGIVATRCGFATNHSESTNKQTMTRSAHVATSEIKSLQLVYPGFYIQNTAPGENNQGVNATITASIEYPENVFTQVLFSASPSGTVPFGNFLTSDSVTVEIPKGERFRVRTWWNCSAGIMWTGLHQIQNAAAGDGFMYGATVTDMTMGGAVTNSSSTPGGYVPCAIISMTSSPSFFISGDSRVAGSYDFVTDGNGAWGTVPRAVQKTGAGYVVAAISGERLQYLATTAGYMAKRIQIAKYCTAVIGEAGINDLTNGATAANLATWVQNYKDLIASDKPLFWTTLEPVSSSTDGHVTLANQTVHSSNPQRLLFNNNTVRAVAPPLAGFIELADLVESSPDSGKWAVPTRVVSDAAITTGTAVLTSATANFTARDLNAQVVVNGAGAAGALLQGVISAVTNATTVTLSVNASTTVSAAQAYNDLVTTDGTHHARAGYERCQTAAQAPGLMSHI